MTTPCSKESEIAAITESLSWIKENITEVRKDLKILNEFRWKLLGITAILGVVVSALVTASIQLAIRMI